MNDLFYRAWHKQEKQMFAVIGIEWADTCPSKLNELTLHGNIKVSPDDIILSSSSGLTDKNAVLIYEGHIVKHQSGQGEVIYKDGAFWVGKVLLSQLKGTVVIGNIFEKSV